MSPSDAGAPSPDRDDAPDVAVGFADVDAQPDAGALIHGMDATARWDAVRALRAWERERLLLQPGEALLDVGCGVGDVAIALAPSVAPNGRVVALDPSDAMLAEGRRRAVHAGVDVDFRNGVAQALPFDDATFDVCRSERALQWLTDAGEAIAEMVRILRPAGRLVLIDTDWRTLLFDWVAPELSAPVFDALHTLRGPSYSVGGRLLNLCRDHGLTGILVTGAVHVWTEWDVDSEPSPAGLFPLRTVVSQLAELELITRGEADGFVRQLEDAARRGRLCGSLTMFATYGRKEA